MNVAIAGIGLFTVAWLMHLALWRVRLPRRQTRMLLVMLVAFPLGLLAGSGLGITGALGLHGGWEHVEAAVFIVSFALAYIITYSGLEADSPTLVIVLRIAEAGGLSEEGLGGLLTDERLVRPRVNDLLRDGLARESGGRYVITPKGRRLTGLFAWYRRAVLGIGVQGG